MRDELVYRTMREQIADRIRSDVLSQRLAEGTSLREAALAQRFGVSRAPIRDALLQLTQEGLLVAKPNCGVRVGPLPDETIQPLVVELRRKIEVFALGRMMDRLGSVDLGPWERIVVNLKVACEGGEQSGIVYCDMAFHRFIIESAETRELLPIWLPIVSRMMLHYTRHRDWMESHREHAAIAAAVKEGDREKAEALLVQNIT